MKYSVFLSSEDQLQLGPLGKALADYAHIPLPDAAHMARLSWGIVSENLEADAAERLLACLHSHGLQAQKIDSTLLPPLPAPAELTHVEVTEAGIAGLDDRREPHSVAWSQIRAVAAAALGSTSIKIIQEKQGPSAAQKALSVGLMLATGLPIPIGPKKKTVERTVSEKDLIFLVDFVTDNPAGCCRILASDINYAFLQNKKEYNVMNNFKLFLAESVRRAPAARLGKGTRVLLNSQPVNSMGYESASDLQRETHWLFALNRPRL